MHRGDPDRLRHHRGVEPGPPVMEDRDRRWRNDSGHTEGPWTGPSQPLAELADTVWMPPVNWFTICLTWLLGMANPTPMLPEP